jgi:hypothetical protein
MGIDINFNKLYGTGTEYQHQFIQHLFLTLSGKFVCAKYSKNKMTSNLMTCFWL